MIVAALTLIVVIIALGAMFVALRKYKRGELPEEPDELQFSNHKRFPEDTDQDLNVIKRGRTRTLRSFTAQGYMSWDDVFDPKNQDQAEQQLMAVYMVIGFYVIAGAVTAASAYMGFTVGYYFGLFCIGYATFIVAWNYIKVRRRKSREDAYV